MKCIYLDASNVCTYYFDECAEKDNDDFECLVKTYWCKQKKQLIDASYCSKGCGIKNQCKEVKL